VADRAAGRLLGVEFEVEVGPPAAGGACVARHEGRVVFVRHALPGERVRVRVTEDRADSFCRADAVEVLAASPDRVTEPCPYARPGRCGGCDWQHATGSAQRAIKAALVREQFSRLAGLSLDGLAVEELPGGLLGWRTRIAYAVDSAGRPGLRKHRSHDIEHVARCLIGAAGIGDSSVLDARWPGLTGIEAARGDDTAVALVAHRPGGGRHPRGRRPPDRTEVLDGPALLRHQVLGRRFDVAADGFWQVHPAAAETFARALLDGVRPRPGERVLDLYAGAGALTAALADAVGPTGTVIGIESARSAVEDAARNLVDLPWAEVRRGRVSAAGLGEGLGKVDVVVLDPPRAGAGRDVMTAILELHPRAVGYVSCDPATLARDVRVARDQGWRVSSVRAFDAFPMTQHVECVATLCPDNAGVGP
jgi:tRNA/tmRNA/rRNA uracil-C5-methylase (TrmA/RlmC/RlmD family)